MTEQTPCPLCQHYNPPENRFCGSCGARLTSGEQLATRQERYLVPATRAWPVKLGPAGKALAVGITALAVESSLSWFRPKLVKEDRSSMPAQDLQSALAGKRGDIGGRRNFTKKTSNIGRLPSRQRAQTS